MSDSGPLTQAQGFALLQRTTDKAWLDAMLAQPDGAAIIASKLAVFEAASLAVTAQALATMISTAPTGRSGVCTLTLQRSDTTASATIPKGYTFVTNLGVELTVACDVQIAVGQSTVALPLLTIRQIDLVNTPGPAFDDILKPGDYPDAVLGAANPVVFNSNGELLFGPSSGAWTPGGVLTTARDQGTATLLQDGTVIAIGGQGVHNTQTLASCELWTPALAPTDKWLPAANLNVARQGHTATLIPDETVLVTGGNFNSTANGMELYTPTGGGSFALLTATMTALRTTHTATLLPPSSGHPLGLVLLVGGLSISGSTVTVHNTAELYDPVTQATTATGSMTTARCQHTATLLAPSGAHPQGAVLITGGNIASGATILSEIYDIASGTFSATTGPMTVARSEHRASPLPSGNILITSGTSAEVFSLTTGLFTATGNMHTYRFAHLSLPLPNGDVLVAAGDSSSIPVPPYVTQTATAETYNEASGKFTLTEGLTQARGDFSWCALSDGRIMAVGGQSSSGPDQDLNSVEIYTQTAPGHTPACFIYISSTPISGAVEDWLSALGNERGCIRQDGEDGEAYRARVRMIPDAVSPLAIARAVEATATALPERWLAEPFNDGADPAVKLAANLGFFDGVFCDSDFCDDPLGVPLADKQPVASFECSGIRESRAYVRVDLVGQLQDPDGSVLYCDDGFCDDPQWGYPDIGTHPVIAGAEQALLQEVQSKVAGGVNFDVYLENSETLQQQGTLSGTTGTDGVPVFTLIPDAGTAWYLREGLLTADMGGRQWAVTGQGIAVRITLDDGTVLQTPWAKGCVPLRSYELRALGYRGQRVTSIEGLGQTIYNLVPGPGGSPGDTMNLIGSFSVNTCTL